MPYYDKAIAGFELLTYRPSMATLAKIMKARADFMDHGEEPDLDELRNYVCDNRLKRQEGPLRISMVRY